MCEDYTLTLIYDVQIYTCGKSNRESTLWTTLRHACLVLSSVLVFAHTRHVIRM